MYAVVVDLVLRYVPPMDDHGDDKLILHAIVSTMAELRNNCSVAYAMLKVGGYVDVPKDRFEGDLSPLEKKFADAMREYDAMEFDQGWDWSERIQRRYPRLIEVIEAIQ